MSEFFEPMQSREYHLLREINAQLEQWGAMERPLKAAQMMTTIPTDKLAEVMAWAQIALRGVVTEQSLARQMRNVTPKPMMLVDGSNNRDIA